MKLTRFVGRCLLDHLAPGHQKHWERGRPRRSTGHGDLAGDRHGAAGTTPIDQQFHRDVFGAEGKPVRAATGTANTLQSEGGLAVGGQGGEDLAPERFAALLARDEEPRGASDDGIRHVDVVTGRFDNISEPRHNGRAGVTPAAEVSFHLRPVWLGH